nr:unnamed protein product [Callosobruchus chinensis]
MERKYSVPSNPDSRVFSGGASEDLHAWSIYRLFVSVSGKTSTRTSRTAPSARQIRALCPTATSNSAIPPSNRLYRIHATDPRSNMYTYLKFGLPRVFPPNQNGSNRSGTPQHFTRNASARPRTRVLKPGSRGPRDGSSGYDSSDNETTTAQNYKHSRKYRSDPDFRMQTTYHESSSPTAGGMPLAAMHQDGVRGPPRVNGNAGGWNRNKSISEANLLAAEYGRAYGSVDPRRNSVADFGHYDHHHAPIDHSHINRPMSKTESHLSMTMSRRGPPSVVRADYLSQDEEPGPSFMYPHLQVCGVGIFPDSSGSCFNSSRHLLLNEISFEIRGGEIMAVMATSEEEGTALLDLVAGIRVPVASCLRTK